ncbi:lysozyme inhibitor LprI family protein [Vibrio breoganii]|uniref:lysozyme inhibitor LprI family protein n=1 Tax=Vibrio breoganii TaxID=553239 RepID=UPI000474DEF1|nr:lysozyme inhibitor LprI family protein [Vibrio breoganii]OEF88284.1 hypothetical protein B003_00605 [Vibrio breoganii 1C10]
MKIKKTLLTLLFVPLYLSAEQFIEKPIGDFSMLSEFSSVNQFENYIEEYVQSCLDESLGGSLTVRCFVNYEIWDRELNYYYQQLYKTLDDDGKELLKDSQRSWLKVRDKSTNFNNYLLDRRYSGKQGSMYTAFKASDTNNFLSTMVKHRALLLKEWLAFNNSKDDK